MNEDIQFQNIDTWRGSSSKYALTFKQIILQHINRCVVNASVEWHGGYWNETGYNPVTRTYVHNSRDVFCNSIRVLRALLLGYFDKKIKPEDEKLTEELNEAEAKYEKAKEKSALNSYRENKIDIHIRLFEQLIMLSKRLNFFEEETTEEEL